MLTEIQTKILNKLNGLEENGYFKKYESDGKVIFHGKKSGVKVLVIADNKNSSFVYYVNEGYQKGTRYTRYIKLRQRQYAVLESAINDIENRYEREKKEEKYQRKREEETKAKMNHPDTFKNDYLNKLIEANENGEIEISKGQFAATYNYYEGLINGYKNLILRDLSLWNDNDYEEFMTTLEKGNINKVILAEESSGLMQHLVKFSDYGWEMDKMTTYLDENYWEPKEKHGIILRKAA